MARAVRRQGAIQRCMGPCARRATGTYTALCGHLSRDACVCARGVCRHVCAHAVCTHVCAHTCVHTRVRTHVCAHTCAHTRVYAHACAHSVQKPYEFIRQRPPGDLYHLDARTLRLKGAQGVCSPVSKTPYELIGLLRPGFKKQPMNSQAFCTPVPNTTYEFIGLLHPSVKKQPMNS